MVKEQQLLFYLFNIIQPTYELINGLPYLTFQFNDSKFHYLLGFNDNDVLISLLKEWCDQKGELKGEQA